VVSSAHSSILTSSNILPHRRRESRELLLFSTHLHWSSLGLMSLERHRALAIDHSDTPPERGGGERGSWDLLVP